MNSRQNIFIFSLIIILLTPGWSVFASEKSPGNLYALSAVLMAVSYTHLTLPTKA